jgi:RNA polymerase sigma-70 factor (ECF subfamily)
MLTGLNDNELISKVLSGDQQAYAGLVNRYQNYVFTLALRFTKNREDAEEVSQDIFIKAYRALADFAGLLNLVPGCIRLSIPRASRF